MEQITWVLKIGQYPWDMVSTGIGAVIAIGNGIVESYKNQKEAQLLREWLIAMQMT